ncbi:MAG: hypothetical protein K0R90_1730, partial [Oscillospiraceae bacterium]|nr:hypothetical protein [Oscillospiraceae bacterium]
GLSDVFAANAVVKESPPETVTASIIDKIRLKTVFFGFNFWHLRKIFI